MRDPIGVVGFFSRPLLLRARARRDVPVASPPLPAARAHLRRFLPPAQTAASLGALRDLWRAGDLGPESLVWTEGMGGRAMVRDVPPLLAALEEKRGSGASPARGPRRALADALSRGSWEAGGARHRAAAAAAAAGQSSPALVLDLLRELKAAQETVRTQRAVIDNLAAQRAALVEAARDRRVDDVDAKRETALARAEAEARDLVVELWARVSERWRAPLPGERGPADARLASRRDVARARGMTPERHAAATSPRRTPPSPTSLARLLGRARSSISAADEVLRATGEDEDEDKRERQGVRRLREARAGARLAGGGRGNAGGGARDRRQEGGGWR